MSKDKIAEWQQRIEKTFCGESGFVGERLFRLKLIEDQVGKQLVYRFSGYLCLIDAFLDFYLETLQNVASRKPYKWTERKSLITGIHVPTFWRFRASYLIYWNGYFIDALSLLRAIFENILQVVALESGIISRDEVFGKLRVEEAQNLSDEESDKLIRKYTKKSDAKVRSHLIGEKSGLSSIAIKDLKDLVKLLHSSVHKSKLNIVWYYRPWLRGKRSLPIYPEYNEDLASIYINISTFIAWMLSKTFPLMQINDKEFSFKWYSKYQILDESFKEAIAGFPKRLGRSIEELVAKKFDFGF